MLMTGWNSAIGVGVDEELLVGAVDGTVEHCPA
jgi:hypothetical protein